MAESKTEIISTVDYTEAEFMAASEVAKEIIWLSRPLNEITRLDTARILKIDNRSRPTVN